MRIRATNTETANIAHCEPIRAEKSQAADSRAVLAKPWLTGVYLGTAPDSQDPCDPLVSLLFLDSQIPWRTWRWSRLWRYTRERPNKERIDRLRIAEGDEVPDMADEVAL